MLAQGLTNRQLAAIEHISERTVENHVRNILGKLGFTSRTQLAVWVSRQPRLSEPSADHTAPKGAPET